VLISSGDGTQREILSADFKAFLTDFESLDNKCGIAVRAKKDVKINDLYTSASNELVAFADTAEKVIGLSSDANTVK